ncbi:UNVERIFIED_CONTAM: hypothetical protein HHA_293258 [Hammondia hammondi]|eukprot:XP_008884709.1 hypothetical protein HHA_293258 [Hammondia hammondi]
MPCLLSFREMSQRWKESGAGPLAHLFGSAVQGLREFDADKRFVASGTCQAYSGEKEPQDASSCHCGRCFAFLGRQSQSMTPEGGANRGTKGKQLPRKGQDRQKNKKTEWILRRLSDIKRLNKGRKESPTLVSLTATRPTSTEITQCPSPEADLGRNVRLLSPACSESVCSPHSFEATSRRRVSFPPHFHEDPGICEEGANYFHVENSGSPLRFSSPRHHQDKNTTQEHFPPAATVPPLASLQTEENETRRYPARLKESEEDSETMERNFQRNSPRALEERVVTVQTSRQSSGATRVTWLRRQEISRCSPPKSTAALSKSDEMSRQPSLISDHDAQKQLFSAASSEASGGGDASPCSFAVSQHSVGGVSCEESLSGVTPKSCSSSSGLIFASPDESHAGSVEHEDTSETNSTEDGQGARERMNLVHGYTGSVSRSCSHLPGSGPDSVSSDGGWPARASGGSASEASVGARNDSGIGAMCANKSEPTPRSTGDQDDAVSGCTGAANLRKSSEGEKMADTLDNGEHVGHLPFTAMGTAQAVSVSRQAVNIGKQSTCTVSSDRQDTQQSSQSPSAFPRVVADCGDSFSKQTNGWSPRAVSPQSPRAPVSPVCPPNTDGGEAEAATQCCRPKASVSSGDRSFVPLSEKVPGSSRSRPPSGQTEWSSPGSSSRSQPSPGLSSRHRCGDSTVEESGNSHTALSSPSFSVDSPSEKLPPVRANNGCVSPASGRGAPEDLAGLDRPSLTSSPCRNESETRTGSLGHPGNLEWKKADDSTSNSHDPQSAGVSPVPTQEKQRPFSDEGKAPKVTETASEVHAEIIPVKLSEPETSSVEVMGNRHRRLFHEARRKKTTTGRVDTSRESTELTSTERVLASVGEGVTFVLERGAASLVHFLTETLPKLVVEPDRLQTPGRARSSSLTPTKRHSSHATSALPGRPHTAGGSEQWRLRSCSPARSERCRSFTSLSDWGFRHSERRSEASRDDGVQGFQRRVQHILQEPVDRVFDPYSKKEKGQYKAHLAASVATRLPPLPPRRASADISRGLVDRRLSFSSGPLQSSRCRPKSTTSVRAQKVPLLFHPRTRSASCRRPEDEERNEGCHHSLTPRRVYRALDSRQSPVPCGFSNGQGGALPPADLYLTPRCMSPAHEYIRALSPVPTVPENHDCVRVPAVHPLSVQPGACRPVPSTARESAVAFVRASTASANSVSSAEVLGSGGFQIHSASPRRADSYSSGVHSFSTSVPVFLAPAKPNVVPSRALSPGPRLAPVLPHFAHGEHSFGVTPHFLHPCVTGSQFSVNTHSATPSVVNPGPSPRCAFPLRAPSNSPLGRTPGAASLEVPRGCGPADTDSVTEVGTRVKKQLDVTPGLRPCRLLAHANKPTHGWERGETGDWTHSAMANEKLSPTKRRTPREGETQMLTKTHSTYGGAGASRIVERTDSFVPSPPASFRGDGSEYRKPPSQLRAKWLREELRRQKAAGELTKGNFPMDEFQDLIEPFEILDVGGVKVYKLAADWKSPESVPPSKEWIDQNHIEGLEFAAHLEDITDVANELFLPATSATEISPDDNFRSISASTRFLETNGW